MGFSIRGRFHSHRDLENAILEQARDISAIRMELATIRGKLAVGVRENRKKTNIDAEIRSIENQLEGQAVAWKDAQGALHYPDQEDQA